MEEEFVEHKRMPGEPHHAPYKAKAILVIPYKVDGDLTVKEITDNGLWTLSQKEDDWDQLSKVGYLSHANISTDTSIDARTNEGIFVLNQKSNIFLNSNYDNSISIKVATQKDDKWCKEEQTITFHFTWKDTSFWGSGPKLITFPLSHLVLVTIPLILDDAEMPMLHCYKFFSSINDAIGFKKSRGDSDIVPTFINTVEGNKTMIELLDEITKSIEGKTPLYTKSFISYICAYNQEAQKCHEANSLIKSACKLAWTNDAMGFTIDNSLTSTKELLDNPGYTRIEAACGTYGTSIVADGDAYKFYNRTDQYFWVFVRLLILRYSLLCMLDAISIDLGNINANELSNVNGKKKLLKNLRERYQQTNLLKAKFKYTEISDQYEFSRMYDMFYKGLKIDDLYKDVEEKLEAIKEIITIENDKIEERNREEALLNDKKNGNVQIFITALVLVLTITSALNDFFDIIEDSYKAIPGIISVAAVIIVMIVFKDRVKEIFGKNNK